MITKMKLDSKNGFGNLGYYISLKGKAFRGPYHSPTYIIGLIDEYQAANPQLYVDLKIVKVTK